MKANRKKTAAVTISDYGKRAQIAARLLPAD